MLSKGSVCKLILSNLTLIWIAVILREPDMGPSEPLDVLCTARCVMASNFHTKALAWASRSDPLAVFFPCRMSCSGDGQEQGQRQAGSEGSSLVVTSPTSDQGPSSVPAKASAARRRPSLVSAVTLPAACPLACRLSRHRQSPVLCLIPLPGGPQIVKFSNFMTELCVLEIIETVTVHRL